MQAPLTLPTSSQAIKECLPATAGKTRTPGAEAEYHHTQIKASLWRYWCSGAQQRDCMKTIAFRKEEGKDGAHSLSKAEESRVPTSLHPREGSNWSLSLEPVL